jgi:hypothetical protein
MKSNQGCAFAGVVNRCGVIGVDIRTQASIICKQSALDEVSRQACGVSASMPPWRMIAGQQCCNPTKQE